MKKIAHLTSVHAADDIRIFHKECSSLAAEGFAVELVARPPRAEVEFGGVKYLPFDQAGGRAARMLLGPIKMFRTAVSLKADLYHFHDPELIPVGLALKALGKRVVYDVHEDVPAQVMSKSWVPLAIRKPLSFAVKLVHRFANRVFDGVVVAREDAAESFSGSNVVLVQNFPLRSEFAQESGRDTRPSNDLQKVVYVGGISEIRGIREMIDAIEIVSRSRKIQLELAGPFQSPALRLECESKPGWRHVNYHEWVNRDQMSKILADSVLGLLLFHPVPNHLTSYPNKLFEYMSAGLPIVASDFRYWEQFITDIGSGLLVDPTDANAIAEAIIQLIDDPEKAARMGAAGSTAVRKFWNWDAEADKLFQLYGKILGQ